MNSSEKSESSTNNEDSGKDFLRVGYCVALCIIMTYVGEIALYVAILAIFIQQVLGILNDEPNQQIVNLCRSLGTVLSSSFSYATFLSDEKPFPFTSWPSPEKDDSAQDQIESVDPGSDIEESSHDESGGDVVESESAEASSTDTSEEQSSS